VDRHLFGIISKENYKAGVELWIADRHLFGIIHPV